MTLTRKMLKAMGVEEDKIDRIIEAHTETVSGLQGDLQKAERSMAQAKDSLQAITRERDEAVRLHDGMKKELDEMIKTSGDAAAMQKEWDEYKASAEAEKANKVKREAIFAALKERGIVKAASALTKTVDLTALTVEGDEVTGLEGVVQPLLEENAWAVESTCVEGVPPLNPPSGGNQRVFTREDITKMSQAEINQNWDAIKKILEMK